MVRCADTLHYSSEIYLCTDFIKCGVSLGLYNLLINQNAYTIGKCIIWDYMLLKNGVLDIDLEITSIDDEYIGRSIEVLGPLYVDRKFPYGIPLSGDSFNAVIVKF